MSLPRLLPLPLLVGSAFLLTGAVGARLAGSAPPASPPPSPAFGADPGAGQLLDEAAARIGPARVAWLETAVWQQVELQGLAYQAEGRYLAAPGRRTRLDLRTRLGDTEGEVRVVSDGTALWQGSRIGGGDWEGVGKIGLPAGPGGDGSHGWSFAGLSPLLQGLRTQMVWGRRELVRRGGREYHKLTGTWADAPKTTPRDGPWPEGLPRQCRLYLDAETLWPARVEWWGPDPPREGECLLVQMEFRDPVLNRPLPAEQCIRGFALAAEPTRR